MEFEKKLLSGRLLRRYKRFLADILLDDGREVTAHCTNTGAMLGCSTPGMRVWLSEATNTRRKLAYTWELVEVEPGVVVGINTHVPNHLVREGITSGRISELQGYGEIRMEVPFGDGTRFDLMLNGPDGCCYVEVKNVTALVNGRAAFPDAVTLRGQKHLRELMRVTEQGDRAVLVFCVQRPDCEEVSAADEIDPEYGKLLRMAVSCGVEVIAYKTNASDRAIFLDAPVTVKL